MFGVDTSELLIVAVLALLVIGPKELPATMRTVGSWIGKVRGMARHFTSGIETMIREAELEEMEKRWREENERIMRDFPTVIDAEPLPASDGPEQLPLLDTSEAPPPLPEPPENYTPGGPEKTGDALP
jgi:sec-independent protein translocase protein TatB